jgi:hypothetical protein
MRCHWTSIVLEKCVCYHILFISEVVWMISKCHSVSCFLLCTDFHPWIKTLCYREWVSFGSLLCSEEHGTSAFVWASLVHLTPSSVFTERNISMPYIMCFYLAVLDKSSIYHSDFQRTKCMPRIREDSDSNLSPVTCCADTSFCTFISPTRQLPQ